MTAAMTAAASFQNMPPPPWCCKPAPPPSGRAVLGDFERVAIGCDDEDRGAGLYRIGAFNARLPARATIAHAREARARVDPALEARRHAGVDRRHLRELVLHAVEV